MHDDGYFGEEQAARYDDSTTAEFQPEVIAATVDFLAGLAGAGPALEFAIGTGRIGVPLAERGVPVSGIELSRAMAAKLREKTDAIDVAIGDMATTRVEGEFSLVYLVFNTIGNLTTQDAQVACFANAAAHLAPGGCFVIEVGVPALRSLPPGQSALVFHIADGYWGIDEFDILNQGLVSHHFRATGATQADRVSMPFRYVWPAELDLMARLAGMRLRERWADWDRSPFTAESTKHVSVWEKPKH